MIEAFGSPIVVDGKAALDKPKVMEAMAFFSSLYTKHKVVPPSAPNDSYRQIMEGFRTGQTAMIWHHTGSLTEIAAALPPEAFMTAVKPAGPVDHVLRIAYAYNGLMQDDLADASWDWVSFWGESDPAIALLDATGYFPASTKVAQDPRITSEPKYQAAVETLKIGRLAPKFPGADAWARTVLLPEFQKILVGSSTVEAAVDNMAKGLEKTLG
jgi:multiple sugar transport system substrate-binding protein